MGGCATKPKDANVESLPRENPTSPKPKQEKRALDGDPTVANEEVNTGNDKTVENTSKEEPLVDLFDPKPDKPNHVGEVKSEETKAKSELMSEIGDGSKPDHEDSSNPVKCTTPDDSMKATVVDHDAEEEKDTAGPAKALEVSEKEEKDTTGPAKALEVSEKEEKQKPDVEAEKNQLQAQKENNVEEGEILASLKSESVETKDIKPEVSEQKQGEKAPLAA